MIIYEEVGGNPYQTYDSLAERLYMHKDTVRSRVKEIIEEIGKGTYPKISIIDDKNIFRVNELVFVHYEANRKYLRHKNLRQYAEPFNAAEVAEMMGQRRKIVKIE